MVEGVGVHCTRVKSESLCQAAERDGPRGMGILASTPAVHLPSTQWTHQHGCPRVWPGAGKAQQGLEGQLGGSQP